MVKELNELDFADFIKSEDNVLVKCGTLWCGPCKAIKPVLEKLETEYPNRIADIDIEDNPEISLQYNITSVPTLLIFKKGELVSKKIGSATVKELSLLLNSN